MPVSDRDWERYSKRFRIEVLPKLMSSAVSLSLIGMGLGLDVRQATEIGAMLLLDKPLILVCVPGAVVPSRLRRAADVVIEGWGPDNLEAQDRLADALRDLAGEAR